MNSATEIRANRSGMELVEADDGSPCVSEVLERQAKLALGRARQRPE